MDLSQASNEKIAEYKATWKEKAHTVLTPCNMDVQGKYWCRNNLARWLWSMESFVDNQHHEFMFERISDAEHFAKCFDLFVQTQDK